ncbi:hypothetical protein EYE40_12395 [Glaciihabitans arcticus]|uniref:Acyl-CoA synthetase n=2 Tax=Glaciihabitans arcticus TaxID=2668039 RepID=A0A4Q9GU92_9MICO|nr:hypothetical protein EYE40_12395 [Glaciihabitans arcticus]
MLARAATAIGVAILITFTADHAAPFGFRMFGVFALVTGVVLVLAALRSADARPWLAAQGVLGIVAGLVAVFSPGAGLAFLVFLVSTWAAVTGFLELYLGLRARRSAAASRVDSAGSLAKDRLFVGGLTALFAVAILLVPVDYNLPYMGADKVERFLTGSIIVVGALGAYCAILGVYLVIAAMSLRWADNADASALATESRS